jgi:hypothetical protein
MRMLIEKRNKRYSHVEPGSMKKEVQKIPAARSVVVSGDELKKVEEPKDRRKKGANHREKHPAEPVFSVHIRKERKTKEKKGGKPHAETSR